MNDRLYKNSLQSNLSREQEKLLQEYIAYPNSNMLKNNLRMIHEMQACIARTLGSVIQWALGTIRTYELGAIDFDTIKKIEEENNDSLDTLYAPFDDLNACINNITNKPITLFDKTRRYVMTETGPGSVIFTVAEIRNSTICLRIDLEPMLPWNDYKASDYVKVKLGFDKINNGNYYGLT